MPHLPVRLTDQPIVMQLLRTSLLLASLTGCSLSPLAKRTAAFSTAATTATQQTENAYQLVERTYQEAQVARLIRRYDTAGFDPASIRPFLPEHDRQVRTRVLKGLLAYAQLLADVSGDRPVHDMDAATASLASSLKGVSAAQLSSAHLTTTDAGMAADAVEALGRALVEHKRRRELPGILRRMQEPIVTICTLLQADLGSADGPGLRNQLATNYDDLIREQKNDLEANEHVMTLAERRAGIASLPALVLEERRGEAALAATSETLGDLARAHSALADTAGKKDAPSFHAALARLLENAMQLQSFYQALPTKS